MTNPRRRPSGLLRRIVLSGSVIMMMIPTAWAGEDANVKGAFDAGQKEELRNIIHDYLLTNPEVVVDAINRLEQREREAEDQKLQVAAESVHPISEADHVRGNREATVKLIESTAGAPPQFFDTVLSSTETIRGQALAGQKE